MGPAIPSSTQVPSWTVLPDKGSPRPHWTFPTAPAPPPAPLLPEPCFVTSPGHPRWGRGQVCASCDGPWGHSAGPCPEEGHGGDQPSRSTSKGFLEGLGLHARSAHKPESGWEREGRTQSPAGPSRGKGSGRSEARKVMAQDSCPAGGRGVALGPGQAPSPPALACPPIGLSPRHWVLSGGTRLHPRCQSGPSTAGDWSARVPRGGPVLLP